MAPSKLLACSICAVTLLAAAGCADGTGSALTPTLPTTPTSAANADGTLLKATPPQPTAPHSAVRVTSLTPELKLRNGAGTFDPNVPLSYVFEIFDETGVLHTSEALPAASPETVYTVPDKLLALNKTYVWKARAIYSGVAGSWSDNVTFRTPVPVSAPPADGRPGPVFCAGTTGREIVACVQAAFPERLVSTAAGDFSLERRHTNMEFLRDRVIETGRCKGLNLGRNFKRGSPVLSKDFIVYRKPGQPDRGVDIARAYDDVKIRLQLSWGEWGPPSYGHPYYANYGTVDCSGLS